MFPRPILVCSSRQPLCFHILAASLSSPKKSTPLQSSKSSLFSQNAGVGWASPMLLRDTRGGVYPPFLSALEFDLPGFGFQAKEPVTPFPPTFSRNIAPKRIESATNCARAPTVPLSTFKINTCKSVSKQRTLSPFRINTCEKQGEGGPSAPVTTRHPQRPARAEHREHVEKYSATLRRRRGWSGLWGR